MNARHRLLRLPHAILRLLVARWLEEVADRRRKEAHRIHRLHPNIGGSLKNIDWEARNHFLARCSAADALRDAARCLRKSRKESW